MYKKMLLAGMVTLLFLGIAIAPATAQLTLENETSYQETSAIERFMDDVETIATNSQTFSEFMEKLQTICLTNDYFKYPVVQELMTRLLQSITKERALSSGLGILDFLGSLSSSLSSNYFVISFGAYHRLNPRKENSINRFKERLSMWHYSATAKLFKGRTLIFERHPFGIHQKMVGPQIGFMKGFKGIFIDIESKLTGNSYVFFLGRAHRIHAFDLTPLSK